MITDAAIRNLNGWNTNGIGADAAGIIAARIGIDPVYVGVMFLGINGNQSIWEYVETISNRQEIISIEFDCDDGHLISA